MRKRSITIVVASALILALLLVPLVSADVQMLNPRMPPPDYAPPPNVEAPPKGYVYRPEWEPHKATWLSWGHCLEEEELHGLQIQMIDALQEGEEVHILVDTEQQRADVLKKMEMAGVPPDNVFIHQIPANEMWLRDWAPTWIDNGVTQAVVDWEFDGWGEQSLVGWEYSNLADRKIAELLGQEFYSWTDFIVDGSACFLVNGKGLCITTDSLTNPLIRKEPIPTRSEIEAVFKAYLGVKKFIWLEGYLTGDTYTYGHANTMAKFVNENTVLCHWQVEGGMDYDVCVHNYEILVDAGLNVIQVPVMETPIFAYGGYVLGGYMNSYIGNTVVLVPQFGDPSDATALAIYEACFPTRTVVGLDCRLLQSWGGAINCITQQQPLVP